ncbi:MAG: HAD-IA family hydrolase [Patescibacteria group bacterium]|nr:HAD-IA family hydrolase [Patescibacteria group bacterium]
MNQEIKITLFDFDGVLRLFLTNSLGLCFKTAYRLGLWKTLKNIPLVIYLFLQEVSAYLSLPLGTSRKDLIPGAIDVISYLKREEYLLGIVTVRSSKILRWHARRLGLDLNVFDIIITRDDDFKKPDPRVFDPILQQWPIKPSEILLIGDSYKSDFMAGKAAGVGVLMITSSYMKREDFLKLGVKSEEIIDSLADLISSKEKQFSVLK